MDKINGYYYIRINNYPLNVIHLFYGFRDFLDDITNKRIYVYDNIESKINLNIFSIRSEIRSAIFQRMR
jgi:hypothetical protein